MASCSGSRALVRQFGPPSGNCWEGEEFGAARLSEMLTSSVHECLKRKCVTKKPSGAVLISEFRSCPDVLSLLRGRVQKKVLEQQNACKGGKSESLLLRNPKS